MKKNLLISVFTVFALMLSVNTFALLYFHFNSIIYFLLLSSFFSIFF